MNQRQRTEDSVQCKLKKKVISGLEKTLISKKESHLHKLKVKENKRIFYVKMSNTCHHLYNRLKPKRIFFTHLHIPFSDVSSFVDFLNHNTIKHCAFLYLIYCRRLGSFQTKHNYIFVQQIDKAAGSPSGFN